ncbi:phage head-tail connector protein [Clostridium tagluense]|uniref:phage head-tail connector protein n=1 Tax=Clostridium tagluense TaxID=360422 RepID=UPI001CF1BFED|nr:phage head-tail connector protein [Clostridium tagluense]MCB2297043.1 phage head-tail connector protein [Clostridium tagluense]
MTILETLKMLLNIELTDISKDVILNYMLQNSKIKIVNYLRLKIDFSNIDSNAEFEINYFNAIVALAKYDYNNQKTVGVKSYSESKRSVNYRDTSDSIPQEIKAMLPLPSIVMW